MALSFVSGVNTVIANLQRAYLGLSGAVPVALFRAGKELEKKSVKLAPKEFGDLRNSSYVIVLGKGWKSVAEVGYRAHYALFVHERIGMRLKGLPRNLFGNFRYYPDGTRKPHVGRFWDPQGEAQAKFLEEPARRLRPGLKAVMSYHLTQGLSNAARTFRLQPRRMFRP